MNGTDPATQRRIQQRISELALQKIIPGEPFFMATPADIAAEIEREFPNVSKSALQQSAYDLQKQADSGSMGRVSPEFTTAIGQVAGSFVDQAKQAVQNEVTKQIQQAAQNALSGLFGNPDWGKIATIAAGLVLIVWGASIYAAPATEDFERHGEAVVGKV